MSTQRFTAVIARSDTKTFISIPFNPDEVWGVKQRHHITGVVNGHKVRGLLGGEGDQFFITLGESWLRDTGLKAGENADVTITPEGPQFQQLPPDLVKALDAEPQARAFFESLATFYRKAYLKWIDGAKRRPEIRAARIQEMIGLLKAGKKQK